MRLLNCKTLSAVCVLLVITNVSCQKSTIRPVKDAPLELETLIVDEQNNLREPVIELMKRTAVPVVHSLHEAIAGTQKAWLRPTGHEFAHLSEQYPADKKDFLKAFDELGMVARIMPTKTDYDYVIFLGAMYSTVKQRLSFLEHLVENGVKFKKIALLGSERPLDHQFETRLMLNDSTFATLPATEIDMMEALLDKSSLSTLSPKPIIIRVAPVMKVNADKSFSRPITKDTLVEFLVLNPKPGTTLVISNQPHIVRQHLVVRSVLPASWSVESVGPSASSNSPTGVFLDELARTLYELDVRSQK